HCTAHGCTVPATWCEVHHLIPWAQGGTTSVTHGTLLCPHHHHLIHDPTYHHERHPDGTIRYHRRT
ncbi:HNH endonuclease signature motif containing protein, partial [Nocardioides sp.]|uniref:HNH endonuclease signature motif containing protein n=1 Tax=Nocardioides sp. TaxID=35761 RepID=UPI00273700E3